MYGNGWMRVAVAFDHRGVRLREQVLAVVLELGHQPVDLGTDSPEPPIDDEWADAPAFATPTTEAAETAVMHFVPRKPTASPDGPR